MIIPTEEDTLMLEENTGRALSTKTRRGTEIISSQDEPASIIADSSSLPDPVYNRSKQPIRYMPPPPHLMEVMVEHIIDHHPSRGQPGAFANQQALGSLLSLLAEIKANARQRSYEEDIWTHADPG